MLNKLEPVDVGIIITQLSVILTHICYGDREQKAKAKSEFRKLEPQLEQLVSDEEYLLAIQRLGLTHEDLSFISKAKV